jgi:uncharacterized protein YqcC (DUF446 family)
MRVVRVRRIRDRFTKSRSHSGIKESDVNYYQLAEKKIEGIEGELRSLGWWRAEPLPPDMMDFRAGFAMDTMPFTYWLQFVFIPNVRAIIAKQGNFPTASHVAAQAVREFDGIDEAENLIALLAEFDAFISSL